MKNINYTLIEELYKKGFSDNKIAKEINCSKRTITLWRKKNNFPSNFKRTKDIYDSWSKEEFLNLYYQHYTDKKIADILKISEKVINSYRNKNCLPSNQSHNIEITKDMDEIIVGTLLGDGYIDCRSKSKIKKEKDTAYLVFAHKKEHKDYCFAKYNSLKTLFNREPKYNIQRRNNVLNESYYAISISSLSLKKYRKIFYIEREKIIPDNIEDYYTKRSLAYHYMDDGYRKNNQYYLSLCSFSDRSINNLRKLLLKWNIETSLHKKNILYIKSKSNKNFLEATEEYIVECMKYKTLCPSKIPLNRETPEMDNSMLN
jgi:hypothetical protein